MLTFLIKKLVPVSLAESKSREKTGIVCSIYGILLNVLLSAAKFFAGISSNSLSIVADAINNMLDAISSVIIIAGLKIASRDADREHPFGHGRAEYISAFLISLMIVITGIEVGRDAVSRILHPQNVEMTFAGCTILFAGFVVKLYMSRYNKKIGKTIRSSAMQAASADCLADALSTGAILVAAVFSLVFEVNIDAWFALGVSAFILYAGIKSARDAAKPIIGAELDRDKVATVMATVEKYPEILGVHDLIIHDYGPGKSFVSFHAEVDAGNDILLLHDIIDTLEDEIKNILQCEAVIHMDPLQVSNAVVEETRAKLADCIREWNDKIQIHDFRMVFGPSRSNLIFDVSVPFELSLDDESIRQSIDSFAKSLDPDYRTVMRLERSFTD